MGLMNLLVRNEPTKVEWIQGGVIWDVCNYKILGLPIAEDWMVQAEDKDLKNAINTGIDTLIIPHIEKLRNFLIKEGLDVPPMPSRKVKGNNNDAYPKSGLLKDSDIANGIRSVYRFGIELDLRLVTYGSRADISELGKELLNGDVDGYINTTKLFYTKNWLLMTPTFPMQALQ